MEMFKMEPELNIKMETFEENIKEEIIENSDTENNIEQVWVEDKISVASLNASASCVKSEFKMLTFNEDIGNRERKILKEHLKSTKFTQNVTRANFTNLGYYAEIKINLTSEEEANVWFSEFSENTKTSYFERTIPTSGSIILCKKFYSCHHKTINDSKKGSKKDIKCPAKLVIIINAPVRRKSKRKNRVDNNMLGFIAINFEHNHHINSDILRFYPEFDEVNEDLKADIDAKVTEFSKIIQTKFLPSQKICDALDNAINNLKNILTPEELVSALCSFGKDSGVKSSPHKFENSYEKNKECQQCGKCFKQTSDLTKHLRIHSGVKPYKCETCDKSFTQIGSLRAHQTLHTGIRL